MLTEREMENAVAANPQKYLGEEGLNGEVMGDHLDLPPTPSTTDRPSEPMWGEKSKKRTLHEQFWQLFLDEMRNRRSNLFDDRKPPTINHR